METTRLDVSSKEPSYPDFGSRKSCFNGYWEERRSEKSTETEMRRGLHTRSLDYNAFTFCATTSTDLGEMMLHAHTTMPQERQRDHSHLSWNTSIHPKRDGIMGINRIDEAAIDNCTQSDQGCIIVYPWMGKYQNRTGMKDGLDLIYKLDFQPHQTPF